LVAPIGLTGRVAIDGWMPLRILGIDIWREIMLMTSVSTQAARKRSSTHLFRPGLN